MTASKGTRPMRRQHTTPNAYPAQLLDGHLRTLNRQSPGGAADAALHGRSLDARALLAYAAGADSVDDLVAAAHGRPGVHPPVARMDRYALGELARVMALQDLLPDDRADALALLDMVCSRFGAVDDAHQGLHCQLAFALGLPARTEQLLQAYPAVPATIRGNLAIDLANPYAGGTGSQARWLAAFRTLLPGPRLELAPGRGPAFDRIVSGSAQRMSAREKITTIVTTYQPGPVLLTTIRSLIAQTWTNQEILLVDDCSPGEYDDVLHAAVALDPRVRLIRMAVNGGTYVARNAGLGEATGVFVTFQDSDDWSHPLRLERQVRPLIEDPELFSTTSVGMRVTEDLVVTRPGFESHRSYNLSSLMIRRRPALQRLGYLDTVRKGADAEYVERARAVFGRPAVKHLTGQPLALIRLSSTSLSSADIAVQWMHPARFAYQSAFQTWHRAVAEGTRTARQPAHPAKRPFAAPRRLIGTAGVPTSYDVILAGDWTPAGGAAVAGTGQLRALTARGQRAGLLHIDALVNLAERPRNIDPEVQELVNAGRVEQITLADEVHTAVLVVRSPDVLHFAPGIDSRVRADRVVIEIAADAGRHALDVCTAASRRLFGTEPQLSPQGPSIRAMLDAAPQRPPLAEVDLPGSVDAAEWRLDRRGPRSDRPVVGRVCGSSRGEWRRLKRILPDTGTLDVRLLSGGGAGGRTVPGGHQALGKGGPPRNWLVYEPAETTLRSFLFQVDFYVPLPDRAAPHDADPTLLQALAAGCVVVLPKQWAPVLGDAAVYGDPADLEALVQDLYERPRAFLQQSRRGQDFVRERYGHDRYAQRVLALTT